MADWVNIKAEYVTTDISLRALADKHGVSFSSIGKKAMREHWKDERTEIGNKVETRVKQKLVSASVSERVNRVSRLLGIGDKITDNLERATTETPLENYDFRTYTVALKNLHDIAKVNEQAGDDEALAKARALLGGVKSAVD